MCLFQNPVDAESNKRRAEELQAQNKRIRTEDNPEIMGPAEN